MREKKRWDFLDWAREILTWEKCFFFLLFFSITVVIQYYISLGYTTLWLDIYITYKLIAPISLVSIWHHIQLLQYYWLYSLYCILHVRDYFYNYQFGLLILSPLFPIPTTALLPDNHQFLLCIYEFVSVLIFRFYILVSFYVWLILFSIISTRSIHFVTNGEISFHCTISLSICLKDT